MIIVQGVETKNTVDSSENREANLPSPSSSFDLNRAIHIQRVTALQELNMEIYKMKSIIQGKEGIKEMLIMLVLDGNEPLLQIWKVL